jgi:hypothetical protein
MRFAIDIAFKGERTYLQSADIFDCILQHTGARQDLKIVFRRLLSHQLEAIAADEVPDPEACPARFSGRRGTETFDLVIVDDPTKAVNGRVPYDEPRVIADATISANTISSRAGNGASVMERIVAMNKSLIHATVKPGKKLLFASATLKALPARDAYLMVRLDSRLGVKLFRSSIHVDEQAAGEIIFYGV